MSTACGIFINIFKKKVFVFKERKLEKDICQLKILKKYIFCTLKIRNKSFYYNIIVWKISQRLKL